MIEVFFWYDTGPWERDYYPDAEPMPRPVRAIRWRRADVPQLYRVEPG